MSVKVAPTKSPLAFEAKGRDFSAPAVEAGHLQDVSSDMALGDLSLDRRFLNVQRNVTEETLSIRRGPIGRVRKALSDEAIAKVLNDQLMEIKPDEVEKIINTFPPTDRADARLVFGLSTKFANLDSLDLLIEVGSYDSTGARNRAARIYAPGETSLSDSIVYLNNQKGIYRDCLLTGADSFRGATFAILDEFLLRKLETNDFAAKQLAESGTKLLLPVGLISGINMFNSVFPSEIRDRLEGILKGARKFQEYSIEPMDLSKAVESYLVESTLERLRKAGIRAGVGDVFLSKVEFVGGVSSDKSDNSFSNEVLSQRLNGSQGISPKQVKDILDELPHGFRALAGELIAQTSMVFSPRSMTRALRGIHTDIARVTEKEGISPDDLYYFTQHSHKSSVFITTAYCMANKISPDKVITQYEIFLASDLPKKSALVVLDDLSGSGETLNDAIRSVTQHKYQGTLILAPLVASSYCLGQSSLSRSLETMPNVKPLPFSVIPALRKSKFYKGLDNEHQVLVERVIGDPGHSSNGLSVTFPHMSPDNCNALWDARFAKHFTLNGKGTQGKYLDPYNEDTPRSRDLETKIEFHLGMAKSLLQSENRLDALYHRALAYKSILQLERLVSGFGSETHISTKALKRELRSLIGGIQEEAFEELKLKINSKDLAIKDLTEIHDKIKVLREYFNSLPRKGAGPLLELLERHLTFLKTSLPLLRNTAKSALESLNSKPTTPELFTNTESTIKEARRAADLLGLGTSFRRTVRTSLLKILPTVTSNVVTDSKAFLKSLITISPSDFTRENISQRQRVDRFCDIGRSLDWILETAKIEPEGNPLFKKAIDATHAIKEYAETKAQILLQTPGSTLNSLYAYLTLLSTGVETLTKTSKTLGEDASSDINRCFLNIREAITDYLSHYQNSLTAAKSSLITLTGCLEDFDIILEKCRSLSKYVGDDFSTITEKVLQLKAETKDKLLALASERFVVVNHAIDHLDSFSLKEIYELCRKVKDLDHSTQGIDLGETKMTYGEISKLKIDLLDFAYEIALFQLQQAISWNPLAITNYTEELEYIKGILLESRTRIHRGSSIEENRAEHSATSWVEPCCNKVRAYLTWRRELSHDLSWLYTNKTHNIGYFLKKVSDRGLTQLADLTLVNANKSEVFGRVDIEKAGQALLMTVNAHIKEAVSQLRNDIDVARVKDISFDLAFSWLASSYYYADSPGILSKDTLLAFESLKETICERVKKEMVSFISWISNGSSHASGLTSDTFSLYEVRDALVKFRRASEELGFEAEFKNYGAAFLNHLFERAGDSFKNIAPRFLFQAIQGIVSALGPDENYRSHLLRLIGTLSSPSDIEKPFSITDLPLVGTLDSTSFLRSINPSGDFMSNIKLPKFSEKK